VEPTVPGARRALRALGLTAAAGLAGVGYALVEAQAFRLRRVTVPVLPSGQRPLRVLHVTDIHLTPPQQRKARWVSSLAALEPDLVVSTGDSLASRDAVPALLSAVEPLLAFPGVFVLGSNDYFAARPKNPARYLRRRIRVPRPHGTDIDWEPMASAFRQAGWRDLDNARAELEVDGRRLAFAGVDDPHLARDRYDDVAGPADATADLTVGVTHAPYLRVLDAMAGDGYRLILAGHTHGGQLCVPGWGALVTNCDLEPRRASGLHRHPVRPAGPGHQAWLHVSAGVGTSPYTPVRFACPPEATLLTLTAGPA
jgi:predicted MPP superfamily phosphohydrolase